MLIDLHVRVDRAAPASVVEAAKKAGLGGLAVVDRLRSSHAKALIEAGQAIGLPVFVGVEIPTNIGRFLCFSPQIDPFMSREEWRQLSAFGAAPSYASVMELFQGLGGAVIASQPYKRSDDGRLGDNLALCEGLSGVEVFTAGDGRIDCLLAVEAAVKWGLPTAAGSASTRHLKDIGQAATLFAQPISTQEELVAALRAGDFWAAKLDPSGNGPSRRPARRREPSRGSSRNSKSGEGGGDDGNRRRRRRRPGPRRRG